MRRDEARDALYEILGNIEGLEVSDLVEGDDGPAGQEMHFLTFAVGDKKVEIPMVLHWEQGKVVREG